MHFRTVLQFSRGSFLKAPRNYVPALLRFLTPKRSTKDEFFMKGRLKLLTGYFLKSGSTTAMKSLLFLDIWRDEEEKSENRGGKKREPGGRQRGQRAEKHLGCQIKWECNRERLVLPLHRDRGENQASSASNFHMSISAQLRSTLRNQSSRKYPWGTAE